MGLFDRPFHGLSYLQVDVVFSNDILTSKMPQGILPRSEEPRLSIPEICEALER